ncbi:MAG: BA14K family protein [Phyllobacterium sp.]
MKPIRTALCAALMALSFTPAYAAPLNLPTPIPLHLEGTTADIVQIRHRDGRRYWRHGGRDWYRGDRWYRDRYRSHRRSGPSFGLYLGVPIFPRPYYEPYYRPRPIYRRPANGHVSWCYQRYRSYRAYDNTFQPYNGPRRQCRSPYW